MPVSGSQIILCDLPLRFDTYEGCSHACSYCFVKRKNDISNIRLGESPKSLLDFINGKRSSNTKWADFNIPIHWGGMSDPFQPAEKVKRNSLECLKIFAQTKYPFVVSTKNKMIAEEPYLSLLKQCDCVVQISAACSKYDDLEMGASTFDERLKAAKIISDAGIRVNIRVQPYIPSCFEQIYSNLALFKESGVHGVIFESMKYQRKHYGCIKIGGDFVFPSELLQKHFTKFKNRLHQYGMKFYCGENRLRQMSDELCCCGVEGMGWTVNTSNLNHYLFDKQGFKYTQAQEKEVGTATPFSAIHQDSSSYQRIKDSTYKQEMERHFKPLYFKALLPDPKNKSIL